VVLGSGVMGSTAARTAAAAGARVTAIDIDRAKLDRLAAASPGIATLMSGPESIAAAVAAADVLIAAVHLTGRRTPHLVSRQMVESMRRGSVIIDASIDQGGCVETSRPMNLDEPAYVYQGVVHYTAPNMTSDISHCASAALAGAVLPCLELIAEKGTGEALRSSSELRSGVYVHAGSCRQRSLSEALGLPWLPLESQASMESLP